MPHVSTSSSSTFIPPYRAIERVFASRGLGVRKRVSFFIEHWRGCLARLSGLELQTRYWRPSSLMYPTAFLSVLESDGHLPRLVESNERIRLVLYTMAHDRVCLDTPWVVEGKIACRTDILRKPAITGRCVTSLDVSNSSTVPLQPPAPDNVRTQICQVANPGPRSRGQY